MKGHHTKKIALPGGRVIEIVYFCDDDSAEAAAEVAAAASRPPEAAAASLPDPQLIQVDELDVAALHICPSCESDLVYPISWEERAGDLWRIERRCPNCEWRDADDFTQEEVEVFDDVLNDGTEDLLVTLRELSRSNMESDIERLIDALRFDFIEPMDF